MPSFDYAVLDATLAQVFSENQNKAFENAVGGLFPGRLASVLAALCEIETCKKANAITKAKRQRLAALAKALPLTVTGAKGFGEAVVTKGGVNVKEVNPANLMSKLVQGLFFAGEVLDVDALSGGFNLQIAFSTGQLAGIGAKKYLEGLS